MQLNKKLHFKRMFLWSNSIFLKDFWQCQLKLFLKQLESDTKKERDIESYVRLSQIETNFTKRKQKQSSTYFAFLCPVQNTDDNFIS